MVLIEVYTLEDRRGFFRETYKGSEFEAHGLPATFVQDNPSHCSGIAATLLYWRERAEEDCFGAGWLLVHLGAS